MPERFAFFSDAQKDLAAQLVAWHTAWPAAGVFAMVAEQDRDMVGALQHQCRAAGVPLVGAVFPQLVWSHTLHPRGILLRVLEVMPPWRLVEGLGEPGAMPDPALRTLVDLAGAGEEGDALFTIFDSFVPSISTAMENIYAQVGDRLNYFGAVAGSETFKPIPCLFDSERLIGGGVLALRLSQHPGAILECGYTVPEQLIPSTVVAGNRITQISWRPAFEVYADMIKRHYGVTVTRENFYEWGVHFPFGIIRADGEILVRIPVALHDDGSLLCVGEIPENALITVVNAIKPGSTAAVQAISAQLAGSAITDGLVYYCAGRRMHLGPEATSAEIRALTESVMPARIGGALTLGEIGMTRRSRFPLFYNATIVTIPQVCA